MEVLNTLENKIVQFEEEARKYGTAARTLSLIRVLVFIGIITNIVFLYKSGFNQIYLATLGVSLIVFVLLIIKHKKADHQFQISKELVTVNKEEINRFHLKLDGLYDGNEFASDEHPYAQDLDVFGHHSLFQMINRSPLKGAQKLLARWMKEKSDLSETLSRQKAVEELSGKLDWLQLFLATSRVITNKKKKKTDKEDLQQLFSWAEKPESTKNILALRISGFILSGINLILLGLVAFNDLPYQYFGISFIINALLLSVTYKRCKELGEQLNQTHLIVKAYLSLIELIEKEEFHSPLLLQFKQDLNNGQATTAIKELDKITYRFSSRASMLYGLIDPVLMFDYHLVSKAVSWKNKQRTNIKKWFDVVDHLNALIGITGFHHLNADYIFPFFTDKEFTLTGTGIGHPLLEASKRISNDFSSERKGEVIIITGSNMSGKSTFERTLGINIVLAQLGAPVCARTFTLHPMDIYTSMRTKDNLEESTSSFYAELKRLRQLLDHVEKNPVTFYVIDEVLKGTNSEDRHKGAVSLAKQLSQKNCFGLISTHDLSLSQLANEDPLMVNYSFNSTIEENKIIFDYKLTPGPCKSFNASKLMEIMGIIISDDK